MGTCSFLLMYICVCQQVSSPSVHPLLLKLRDAERQRTHKVVPAGQVPVPDLHRQPAVLVRLLQITVRHRAQEGDRQSQRNQAQHFISHFSDKQITDLIWSFGCATDVQSESFLTMWRSRSTWDSGSTWWSWSSVCSRSWGQGWVLVWRRGQRVHWGPWAPGSSPL